MKARTLIIPALLIPAFLWTSCQKDEPNEPAQAREFKVRMTDAPADYTALNVQVISVDAYHEDGDWVNLSNETHALNILDLTNGEEKIIAKKNVKAGMYTKLRISFAQEATVKVTEASDIGGNGTTISSVYDLQWDDAAEVTVDIAEKVTLVTGANVLIDFNAAASVKEIDGEYHMNPVITLVDDEGTGIKGDVDGSAHALITLTRGDEVFSTYSDITGAFLMRGIPPGTYDLVVDPETEGAFDNGTTYHLEGLVINRGTVKNLGTINI